MLRYFEGLTEAFPSEPPSQPPQGLLAFCRHYSRGFMVPLIVMSLLTAIIAVLEVSLFNFMGQLVDWLVDKNPETFLQEEAATLWWMGGTLLVLLPLVVFLHAAVLYQTLLGNYPMSIRWLAHRYLLNQSLSFFQNDFAGRIATKVMQTSLAVREAVMKLLDVLVYIGVYFAGMVYLVASADYRLMLPMVVWLAAYIGIQSYFIPRIKRISAEQADARSTMTGRVVDSYTNIATVKLFSHTQREAVYAQEGMQDFLDTVHRQMRLVTWLNFTNQSANFILVFSMGAMSLWLWMQGETTVGGVAIAVTLALRLNGMSQWIMWEISSLFEQIGTAADGMNTLSKPQEVRDQPNAQPLELTHGAIHYRDVGFHYGKGGGVIEQLNLEIKAGEKVGLVGRSGAGKSTLVNLLLRFHDLEHGEILIDGQNIQRVAQDSLRSHIGMVTQDTSLLHRSVRENILYGKPDASEEALQSAIARAKADEFIFDLTDPHGNQGLEAQVGERGVKLSGGQRQRVAIARVLLKNAPILVLDEATSALDSEVEAAIQDSLRELMENKTVIAIAHRLSTIAAMDRLIVLDQGNIVEMGSHAELIEQGGIYAQLWAHQTGGFICLDDEPSDAPT